MRQIHADDGEVLIRRWYKNCHAGTRCQMESASVLDVVMEGDDKVAQALKTIIKPVQNAPWATMKPGCHERSSANLRRSERLGLERRARALIDSMGLDADACLSTLSGVVNAVFC